MLFCEWSDTKGGSTAEEGRHFYPPLRSHLLAQPPDMAENQTCLAPRVGTLGGLQNRTLS